MHLRLLAAVLAASALTTIAGCATPPDYRASELNASQSVTYGTVQSVRPVRVGEDSAPVGTIAGAAIGGLLGNTIGHGGGRAAATILGAVGGGFAGNAIEHNVSQENGEEIVVRLDNGSTIAVVQSGFGFGAGQRVRVLSGPRGSRVEPA